MGLEHCVELVLTEAGANQTLHQKPMGGILEDREIRHHAQMLVLVHKLDVLLPHGNLGMVGMMHLDGQLHVQLLAGGHHSLKNFRGDGVLGADHLESGLFGVDHVVEGVLHDLFPAHIPVGTHTHIDVCTVADGLQVVLLQQILKFAQPPIGGVGIFRNHLGSHDLDALEAHVGHGLEAALQIKILLHIVGGHAVKRYT